MKIMLGLSPVIVCVGGTRGDFGYILALAKSNNIGAFNHINIYSKCDPYKTRLAHKSDGEHCTEFKKVFMNVKYIASICKSM